MLGALPLHLTYYLYSFLAFAAGTAFYSAAARKAEEAPPIRFVRRDEAKLRSFKASCRASTGQIKRE